MISVRMRLRIEQSASSLESPWRAGSLAESGPKTRAEGIAFQEWHEGKYDGVRQTSGPLRVGMVQRCIFFSNLGATI